MSVFTWSQTAADNDDADGTINCREGQAPSTINDSMRAIMAAIAKWRDDMSGNLVTAGTSTAYTVTTNQSFSALTDGIMFAARMNATNGASPTLAVDGLTAKQIEAVSGTNVGTGALLSGAVYTFVYDSSSDSWIAHANAGGAVPLAAGGTGASLTDPNADRILFWDDSAGAVVWLTVGTGLAISDTTVSLSHLGIESLSDPGADAMLAWDDSAGATAFMTLGDGIETSGTTLQANIATQAEMEAASSTATVTAPGRMFYHPGVAKAQGVATVSAGTPTLQTSYNISSVTDDATGFITFNLSVTFSSTNQQSPQFSCRESGVTSTANRSTIIPQQTTSSVQCQWKPGSSSGNDPEAWNIAIFGDL